MFTPKRDASSSKIRVKKIKKKVYCMLNAFLWCTGEKMVKSHSLAVLLCTVFLSLCNSGAYPEGAKPFTYQVPQGSMEIVCNNEPSFTIQQGVGDFARYLHRGLNSSLFFDTKFIRNPEKVREWHLKDKPCKGNVGKLITIKTADGVDIACTYFDRGSSVLTIVGEGFTNEREIMTPFVDMFDTDVVLFDFRGHGYEAFSWFNVNTWCLDLAKNTFGMDARLARLGQVEEEDVFAVVDFFKNKNGKAYTSINGVSVCYASFIFLKAEALWNKRYNEQLFSKIVVDGCWDSIEKIVEKILKDVRLLCVPQTGGWGENFFLKHPLVQATALLLARNVWQLQFDHDVRLTDYLSDITQTPVLFFYGKDDLMVYRNEFEDIWNAFTAPCKVAAITNNPHVINHLKQKELYKMVCDLFFECSLPEFKELLTHEEKLRSRYANKLLQAKVSAQ
jgi:hypothetical protein